MFFNCVLKDEVFVLIFIDTFDKNGQTGQDGGLVLFLLDFSFSEDFVEGLEFFRVDFDNSIGVGTHFILLDLLIEVVVVKYYCIFLLSFQEGRVEILHVVLLG